MRALLASMACLALLFVGRATFAQGVPDGGAASTAADSGAMPDSADSSDSGTDAPSEAITPPILRSRSEATYPPDALRDRVQGVVGLDVVIDETGQVVDARVTAPAGHGFDEAAVEAVKRFRFEPARRNGVAIRSSVQFAYEFHPPAATPPLPPPSPSPLPAPAPPRLQQGVDQSTLVLAQRDAAPVFAAPPPTTASESSTGQNELSLRSRYRAEGMLEVVPGVFSVQHAGGGKAQQDFAYGFNLDHGTDLAFFVDGLPVNAVSHAHGQGYSDLHFLIPETVARIDSTKGTYTTDVGDFGTAGSIHFRMADHTDESVAKLELAPSTGHERLVVVESPDFGKDWRMAVATEVFHENGPFIHPEDYGRLNGYAKLTRVLDSRSEISFELMAYGGSWNMSGVLPARAVCGEGDGTPTPSNYAGSNCISRWDSVDPSQGGASQRFMALTQYRRNVDDHWTLDATAYALHSNLQLFPNDGIDASFQPDGQIYGSQVEQDDTRTEMGGDLRLIHRTVVGGMPLRTTLGMQIRNDDIEAQLHRTQARRRLDGVDASIPGPMYDGHTNETETGVWAEGEARPARWLRFVLGARGDRVDAATNNENPAAFYQFSGYRGAAQLSPKAAAIVSPLDAWDLFANYGRGFHTNDIRSQFLPIPGPQAPNPAGTLIAAASAYETGTTVRPVPGLSVSASVFLIDLTSELAIDGDTASTQALGPTRRYGVEATGRYEFEQRIYADATFTASHGRFTDAADVAAGTVYLPDAPIRTFSASVGGRQPVGNHVTLLGSVTVRSMSHRWGDQGPVPLVETGWTVVNAEAGVRWKHVELVADLFNVANVDWREGQFEVSSQLPREANPPPAGISFTPGLPRTLMVHGAVYW